MFFKVVLKDGITQKVENKMYEMGKYYLVSNDFALKYKDIFKVIGQQMIEIPDIKKEITDISEIKNNEKTALIVLNNENSIKTLEEYGIHNIPENVDTFLMKEFDDYCQKSNWQPTYYCSFFENETEDSKNDTNDKTIILDLSKPFSINYLNNECSNNETNTVKMAIELGYKKIIIIGIESNLSEAKKGFWKTLEKQIEGKNIKIVICGNKKNNLNCFEYTSLIEEFGEKNKKILTFYMIKKEKNDIEIVKKMIKKTFKDLGIFDLILIDENVESNLDLEKYKNFIKYFKIDEVSKEINSEFFNEIKTPYIMLLNNTFNPSTKLFGNIIQTLNNFSLEKNYLTIIDNYIEIGYIFKIDYFKDNAEFIYDENSSMFTGKNEILKEKKIWFNDVEEEKEKKEKSQSLKFTMEEI